MKPNSARAHGVYGLQFRFRSLCFVPPSLISLGYMTRAQKILDFLFGVTLISGAPAITFLFLFIVMSSFYYSAWWWAEGHPSLPAAYLIMLVSVLATFILACLWRRNHRRLSASTFIAEVVVAVLVAAFFIIFFMAGERSAYHAEWG